MKGIWVPVSGAIAQQKSIETMANNIANANTPGFKKDSVVFKEYLTSLENPSTDIDIPRKEFSPEDFYKTQGAENAFVKVDGQYTNHAQGQMMVTQNSFDLALEGPGMFEVLTPTGVRYTRKGSLSLSPQGELVTEQGFHVLSKAGEESGNPESRKIPIPQGSRFNVNLQGDMFTSQGAQIGSLSVVEFRDPVALRKEGNSLFVNLHPENLIRETQKTNVRQGMVEGSNVNVISEMSELIKAHRHFEGIQNAIKAYDQITGKSVNDMAKF